MAKILLRTIVSHPADINPTILSRIENYHGFSKALPWQSKRSRSRRSSREKRKLQLRAGVRARHFTSPVFVPSLFERATLPSTCAHTPQHHASLLSSLCIRKVYHVYTRSYKRCESRYFFSFFFKETRTKRFDPLAKFVPYF